MLEMTQYICIISMSQQLAGLGNWYLPFLGNVVFILYNKSKPTWDRREIRLYTMYYCQRHKNCQQNPGFHIFIQMILTATFLKHIIASIYSRDSKLHQILRELQNLNKWCQGINLSYFRESVRTVKTNSSWNIKSVFISKGETTLQWKLFPVSFFFNKWRISKKFSPS